jgi:thiol:disulfide interchange protein DsbC
MASPTQAASTSSKLLDDLRQRFPKTEFTSVSETPIPDVFEVWMGENVAYVSTRNPRYFVLGRVFDTETLQDVTGPKIARAKTAQSEPPSIDIGALPLEDAIKTVRGSGERMLVVFSDPACPYCQRLEPELAKLKDVTVYTFLLPFQGAQTPAAIWCAPDRQQAWQRYMSTGDRALPAPSAPCEHPLDRNLALARRLDVNGTPAVLFADGSRLSGYAQAPELDARLKPASKAQAGAPHPMTKENL